MSASTVVMPLGLHGLATLRAVASAVSRYTFRETTSLGKTRLSPTEVRQEAPHKLSSPAPPSAGNGLAQAEGMILQVRQVMRRLQVRRAVLHDAC